MKILMMFLMLITSVVHAEGPEGDAADTTNPQCTTGINQDGRTFSDPNSCKAANGGKDCTSTEVDGKTIYSIDK